MWPLRLRLLELNSVAGSRKLDSEQLSVLLYSCVAGLACLCTATRAADKDLTCWFSGYQRTSERHGRLAAAEG